MVQWGLKQGTKTGDIRRKTLSVDPLLYRSWQTQLSVLLTENEFHLIHNYITCLEGNQALTKLIKASHNLSLSSMISTAGRHAVLGHQLLECVPTEDWSRYQSHCFCLYHSMLDLASKCTFLFIFNFLIAFFLKHLVNI